MDFSEAKQLENVLTRELKLLVLSHLKDLGTFLLSHPNDLEKANEVFVTLRKVLDALKDSEISNSLRGLEFLFQCMSNPLLAPIPIPPVTVDTDPTLHFIHTLSKRIPLCSTLQELQECRELLQKVQSKNDLRNSSGVVDEIDFCVYEAENLMDITNLILTQFLRHKIPFHPKSFSVMMKEYDPQSGNLEEYLRMLSNFQIRREGFPWKGQLWTL